MCIYCVCLWLFSVLCSVMSCSLWFWCTSNVSRSPGYEELRFAASFYLVVAAASCAVLAGAINLLRFKPYQNNQRTGFGGNSADTAMMNLLAESEAVNPTSILPSYQP